MYMPEVLLLSQLLDGTRPGINGKLLLIQLNLLLQSPVLGRVEPICLKLLRSTRDPVLHTRSDLTLLWVGDRGQEVTRRLTLRAKPAHSLKVVLGLACGTKVDLSALVQDDGLVEQVVDGLTGLVDGHGVGAAGIVGSQSDGLSKLQGCCRIQTACTAKCQ
jgi:hypothetical protein